MGGRVVSGALKKRRQPAPHSWKKVGIGMGLVAAGVGVSLFVMVRYLDDRPLDLFNHSAQMVIVLEDTLAANAIPPSNIRRGEPMAQQDGGASWYVYDVDVVIPEGMSTSRVMGTVEDVMALNEAVVTEESEGEESRERVFSLSVHGREFAVLRLMELAPRLDPDQRGLVLAGIVKEQMNELGVVTKGVEAGEEGNGSSPIVLEGVMARSLAMEDLLRAVKEEVKGTDGEPEAEVSLAETEVSLAETEVSLAETDVSPAGADVPASEGPVTEGVGTLTLEYDGRAYLRVLLRKPAEPRTESPALPKVVLPQMAASAKTYAQDEGADAGLPEPEEAGPESDGLGPDEMGPVPKEAELPLESNGLGHEEMGPLPDEEEGKQTAGPRKVAIIVDDGGYGGAVTEAILALDTSLTLAILPHAPHSRATAKRAREKGFEVLLHMPMENSADKKPFPGHIATGMKPKEIRELTEKALKDVPNAVGANNHEGSKFTAHGEALKAFLTVMKEKGLFFVDSRTIAESVAYDVAKELGIRTARRDVFLDHDGDPDVIRGQFKKLVELAKKRGQAIGICHFRPRTAELLTELLPLLKAEQVELVHVSELVE